MAERVIFHVDVNSAFLSWTAAWRLQQGSAADLRKIPSVIATHANVRTSVVLAKSIPARQYGIKTGEPLGMARDKCPALVAVEPDYDLYVTASRRLMALLREVCPSVEQYSIDEAWADMTGTQGLYGPPVLAAERLKNRIRDELGFTVNIGVSSNKLLAKMAGDFSKPDKVHSLFPHEIEQKLWPLGVRKLFMVGSATERKLARMGIRTIGDLARADPVALVRKLGKPAQTLWQYANGREGGQIAPPALNKSYGNATTTPSDVTTYAQAQQVLLSLCETVGMRLRLDAQAGACVTVSLRDKNFGNWSHQMQLQSATNATAELYEAACALLRGMWDESVPLRQLGVAVTRLSHADACRQCSLFDTAGGAQREKLDAAVDAIREKYGESAVVRGALLKSEVGNMAGGLHKERRTGITKPVDDPAARMLKKLGIESKWTI